MSVTFDDVIARADDETLQELVGRPAVRLLNAMDPSLTTASKLREICLKLHTPQALLQDQTTRNVLISLMAPADAEGLASSLDLGNKSVYDVLRSVKIRRDSQRERLLLAYFGLVSLDPPDREIRESVESCTADYALFDHQRSAQRAVQTKLHEGKRKVVLHMPTGAGKTRTALHVVSAALRRAEPSLVIWLAYSDELCEQAATEFETAWSHLGDRPANVYRLWGARDIAIESLRDGFVVAGLGKVYQKAKADGDFIARLADRTSLVVIDEAHQAIAETYAFVLGFLVGRHPETGLLGLTATPGRTWNDPDRDEELAEFFDRAKVTLTVDGYENPVEYLVAEGYLAAPEYRDLPYGTNPLPDRVRRELAASLDVPDSVLRLLAEDEQRNLVILAAVEDLKRRHERILVFSATVDHAILLAAVLQARGIDAKAVTGQTPSAERQQLIKQFRSSRPGIQVLCNYGVLTTGFDAPRTSAVVVARPTRSLVLYSQMIGRALRGPRAGGNDRAEVVTVVDTNLPGFGSMSEAFNNWEDVWDD